jgi:hypothetical protein
MPPADADRYEHSSATGCAAAAVPVPSRPAGPAPHRPAARLLPAQHYGRHPKIQVGMIHARKPVIVITEDDQFTIVINSEPGAGSAGPGAA